MLGREQIDRWRKEGLITPQQAEKLRATLPEHERQRALGASPLSGTALLFLSALLSGAVIFLFRWLHDVDAPAHEVLLLWMLATAPVVYVLRLLPLVILFTLLFFTWVGLFTFGGLPDAIDYYDRLALLPLPFLMGGVLLFAVGGTHYLLPRLAPIARTYRIAAVQVVLAALFALSMYVVSGDVEAGVAWRDLETNRLFLGALGALLVGAAAFTGLNMRLAARRPELTRSEGPISLALLAVGLLYALLPLPGLVYTVFFNLVALALVGAVGYVGYRRADLRLLRLGGGGLVLFLSARYVDLAWDRLGVVAFVGGLVLVPGLGVLALWLLDGRLQRQVADAAARDGAAGDGAGGEGAAEPEPSPAEARAAGADPDGSEPDAAAADAPAPEPATPEPAAPAPAPAPAAEPDAPADAPAPVDEPTAAAEPKSAAAAPDAPDAPDAPAPVGEPAAAAEPKSAAAAPATPPPETADAPAAAATAPAEPPAASAAAAGSSPHREAELGARALETLRRLEAEGDET